jgi:hypothetical protein
MNGGKPQINVI